MKCWIYQSEHVRSERYLKCKVLWIPSSRITVRSTAQCSLGRLTVVSSWYGFYENFIFFRQLFPQSTYLQMSQFNILFPMPPMMRDNKLENWGSKEKEINPSLQPTHEEWVGLLCWVKILCAIASMYSLFVVTYKRQTLEYFVSLLVNQVVEALQGQSSGTVTFANEWSWVCCKDEQ